MALYAVIVVCIGMACLRLVDPAGYASPQQCQAALTGMRATLVERLEAVFGTSVQPKKLKAIGMCEADRDVAPAPELRGEDTTSPT